MSVERQDSCGGQSLFIVLGLAWAIGMAWQVETVSTTVKIISNVLSVVGCVPLGKIGFVIGNAITGIFCPDAVFSTSAVRNTFYMLGWQVLPKLICCTLLICIPAAAVIGLASLFNDNSREYSDNTSQITQTKNNKVVEEKNIFTVLLTDVRGNGLIEKPLAAAPRVFLFRDSKWVLYLYVANAEFNTWTIYKETNKIDGGDLDTIAKTILYPEIVNDNNYKITCCRTSKPEYIVKTPKGNYYSVSTLIKVTEKNENDFLKYLKNNDIIEDKGFNPSKQLLDICSGKKGTSNIKDCIMWANLNVKNKDGSTPLILACQNGLSEDVIKDLIAYGADLNIRDKQGKTALYWAKINKNDYIISLLEEAGAKE